MQLTRYIEIQQNLFRILRLSDIKKSLRPILFGSVTTFSQTDKTNLTQLLFSARENLFELKADVEIEKIAKELNLLGLFSVELITQYVIGIESRNTYQEVRNDVNLFSIFNSLYWACQAFEMNLISIRNNVVLPRIGGMDENLEILEFEAYELPNHGFDPNQVARVLTKIEPLFHAVARATNVQPGKITVAYFDSGSDLILAIKASKEVIKEVRILLVELLPQIRDWKSSKLSKKIEASNQALSLFSKIDQMEKEGVMNSETASRAKYDVMKAASQLLSSGAYIREVKPAIVDYKNLLKNSADVKLIEGPKDLSSINK